MKVKMICGALVTTAALASGTQALATEVQADGSVKEVVVQRWTGEAAQPFYQAMLERLRERAASGDPVMSKGAADYLKQLESGGVIEYSHETTRPLTQVERAGGIQPMDTSFPPTFAGQTTIDQTCQRRSDGRFTVVGVLSIGVSDGSGGFAWETERSITSVMSICPVTNI